MANDGGFTGLQSNDLRRRFRPGRQHPQKLKKKSARKEKTGLVPPSNKRGSEFAKKPRTRAAGSTTSLGLCPGVRRFDFRGPISRRKKYHATVDLLPTIAAFKIAASLRSSRRKESHELKPHAPHIASSRVLMTPSEAW